MSDTRDRLVSALLDERDRRARAEDECAALRRRVAVLDAKLIEVTDRLVQEDAVALRRAYRRGYETGHAAGRAGARRRTDPERVARGALGMAMRQGMSG